MSAIAAYRTAILALLADPTLVIFTNNDVDQALRWALAEYSYRRPLIRTYQFSVDVSTSMHQLPADFITRHITRVQLYNADPDSIVDLSFYAFKLDEQWMINTRNFVEVGEVLQISYSDGHQVDGLDSAAGTTVPDADETLLEIGAAGHAAQMRALNRVETINMNPDVVKTYRDQAIQYLTTFSALLTSEPGPQAYVADFPGDRPGHMEY
jgi:hypothetical protein